jgi:2,3-bisphosphoglycerate-independent phosphoglycerate mutase
MVGHTGVEPAAIKAIEVLDECIGVVCAEAKTKGYDVLITADHGNSECMVDPITKAPHTAHTTNPVPLIWIGAGATTAKLNNGKLADIAPTILDLFGWPKPSEMTGHSLLKPL